MRWVDLGLPEAAALRREVLPEVGCGCEHSILGVSATDLEMVGGLSGNRPTLVIMEGLSMYEAMVKALCARFPEGGEVLVDVFHPLARRTQKVFGLMWRTGSSIDWVRWCPSPGGEGLRCFMGVCVC